MLISKFFFLPLCHPKRAWPPRTWNLRREWTACWHERMSRLSAILSVPIKPGYTPQIAARKLSKRAMKDLYQTQRELEIGADGCRNGILWRYYHPG